MKKRIFLLAQIVFFALFMSNAKAQSLPSFRDPVFNSIPSNIREEIRMNVNWIMAMDYAADVKKVVDSVIIVDASSKQSNAFRGFVGGRYCGHTAAIYAAAGYREAALSWLNTAKSHQPNVQALFYQYRDYALAYASHPEFLRQAIEAINRNPIFKEPGTYWNWKEKIDASLER